jgi:hypothetical protein
VCGEGEWVITHAAEHSRVSGPREVVECLCSREGAKESKAAWHRKKLRQAGKVVEATAGKRARGQPGWITTPAMAEKAAEALARGLTPTEALREAGYPPSTVKGGKRGINRAIRAELKRIGGRYIEMGRDLSPEDQENIVRGRLLENVILGTDKGVQSAKQLGSDKRISMWQPDSQVGLVVLKAPEVKKINHRVPLLPAKYEDEDP